MLARSGSSERSLCREVRLLPPISRLLPQLGVEISHRTVRLKATVTAHSWLVFCTVETASTSRKVLRDIALVL